MKKIVALGAIAALAGGMIFADEPAIDTKIAAFDGNAEVKWGVDLDAGQHGFTNNVGGNLKVNLWNEGTKETSGDGIWADIQVKGAAGKVENGADNWGSWSIERAMLHIYDFYVDIRSGNTQVGEYKPDAAIKADKAWLANHGLEFKNGIQAGYNADAFKFSLDFRSYDWDDGDKETADTDYTSAYGIALNASLKDNLVPGLTVDAGLGMNLSKDFKHEKKDATIEGKVTDENASLAGHEAQIYDKDNNPDAALLFGKEKDYTQIAYAAKAAYKISIDDGMYVKPSVGFRGSNSTWKDAADKACSALENELAAGVLFGWGDMADANAGVPFFGDECKKVTPGVGVVAYIPLPSVSKNDDSKWTMYDACKAVIVPSFYLGDKVTGLKAAAYGEIALFNYQKEDAKYAPARTAGIVPAGYVIDSASDDWKTGTLKGVVKENETTAIAFAAGIAYGIAVDDKTITPSAGFRYANAAYVANGLEGKYSDMFLKLGMQNTAVDDATKETYKGDFFNLKIGVEFAGFLDNTTFSANYSSANLLNGISDDATKSTPAYTKDSKYYNVKLGTFDIGCKISL